MNQRQINRTNMIESVIAFLELHNSEISQSTGLVDAVGEVKTIASSVRSKSNEKKGNTQGKSVKKRITDEALTRQAVKIAAGLFVWAKKNNNVELKTLADFNRSGFISLRDAEKVNLAKAVYEAAVGKDLSFVSILPADITKLNTLAENFKSDIASLNTGTSKRSAAGKAINVMLDEATEIIKEECDKMMLQFSESKPELYDGYKTARVIHDKGGKNQNGNNPRAPPNP